VDHTPRGFGQLHGLAAARTKQEHELAADAGSGRHVDFRLRTTRLTALTERDEVAIGDYANHR
jgi:hypothetical protein